MLARLDTVMSARLAAVSNATGPFSLAPAVAGLREYVVMRHGRMRVHNGAVVGGSC